MSAPRELVPGRNDTIALGFRASYGLSKTDSAVSLWEAVNVTREQQGTSHSPKKRLFLKQLEHNGVARQSIPSIVQSTTPLEGLADKQRQVKRAFIAHSSMPT